jgi:putative ABC transport system permease protein
VTKGRTFSAAEDMAGVPVAIISEGLAARFWPGVDPIGRKLDAGTVQIPLTIVGVVRDTSNASLWREKELSLYLPHGLGDARDLHLIVRANGDPQALANLLRLRAHAVDAGVRFTVTPLDSLLRLWILPSRAAAIAAAILGMLALSLASLGLYAVMAYDVAHRTREIGVRMALGADGTKVIRLVLGGGMRLLAIGVAAGVAGALVIGRLLRQFLFDVSSVDPLTYVFVLLFLGLVAMLACYIPARRASRIEPLDALRSL